MRRMAVETIPSTFVVPTTRADVCFAGHCSESEISVSVG